MDGFKITICVIFCIGISSLNRSSIKMMICTDVLGEMRLSADLGIVCYEGGHLAYLSKSTFSATS